MADTATPDAPAAGRTGPDLVSPTEPDIDVVPITMEAAPAAGAVSLTLHPTRGAAMHLVGDQAVLARRVVAAQGALR